MEHNSKSEPLYFLKVAAEWVRITLAADWIVSLGGLWPIALYTTPCKFLILGIIQNVVGPVALCVGTGQRVLTFSDFNEILLYIYVKNMADSA